MKVYLNCITTGLLRLLNLQILVHPIQMIWLRHPNLPYLLLHWMLWALLLHLFRLRLCLLSQLPHLSRAAQQAPVRLQHATVIRQTLRYNLELLMNQRLGNKFKSLRIVRRGLEQLMLSSLL